MSAAQARDQIKRFTSANPMDAVQQSLMGSGATNPSYSSPLFG